MALHLSNFCFIITIVIVTATETIKDNNNNEKNEFPAKGERVLLGIETANDDYHEGGHEQPQRDQQQQQQQPGHEQQHPLKGHFRMASTDLGKMSNMRNKLSLDQLARLVDSYLMTNNNNNNNNNNMDMSPPVPGRRLRHGLVVRKLGNHVLASTVSVEEEMPSPKRKRHHGEEGLAARSGKRGPPPPKRKRRSRNGGKGHRMHDRRGCSRPYAPAKGSKKSPKAKKNNHAKNSHRKRGGRKHKKPAAAAGHCRIGGDEFLVQGQSFPCAKKGCSDQCVCNCVNGKIRSECSGNNCNNKDSTGSKKKRRRPQNRRRIPY